MAGQEEPPHSTTLAQRQLKSCGAGEDRHTVDFAHSGTGPHNPYHIEADGN